MDSRPRHLSQDPPEEEIPNKAGTERRRNTARGDERVRVVPRQARFRAKAKRRPLPSSGDDYFTTTSAARRASKVTEGPPEWI